MIDSVVIEFDNAADDFFAVKDFWSQKGLDEKARKAGLIEAQNRRRKGSKDLAKILANAGDATASIAGSHNLSLIRATACELFLDRYSKDAAGIAAGARIIAALRKYPEALFAIQDEPELFDKIAERLDRGDKIARYLASVFAGTALEEKLHEKIEERKERARLLDAALTGAEDLSHCLILS